MIRDFILKTSKGNQIQVTTYLKGVETEKNAIIFVHGFKGFKDWGFVPYLSEYFFNNGFFVVTFNFSHNGIGSDKTEFTELEKFAKNTISLEVSELNEILDSLKSDQLGIEFRGKIGLLGHSRGGAVSLLTAGSRNNIDAVALWASISKFNRYSERQKELWRKNGYFEVLNTRTNQLMRLNVSFLDDIEKNASGSLNLEKSVRNLNCPLFIAHGDQDLAVPIIEAEQIYEWSDKEKTEFYRIFGTGHTFDINHPFNGTNEKFEKLLRKTNEFFKRNLT